MPNQNPRTGSIILARNSRLSEEEWLELLESRRSLIKPHLKNFPLKELGDIRLGGTPDNFGHPRVKKFSIRDSMPKTNFSLDTQGIFSNILKKDHERQPAPKGEFHLWSLTRNGNWITVRVDFEVERVRELYHRERAETVHIEKSIPEKIVEKMGISLEDIWLELGEAVVEWHRFRKELYNKADMILETVRIEEFMLRSIRTQK